MLELIRPDWPAPGNIRAFTTTRIGGFSKDQWSSLNLGENCGDNPNHVKQNRELLRSLLPGEPRWLRQVHGNKAVAWDEGRDPALEADAIFTNQNEQVCAVLTADCLPVIFCNKRGTKVAAAHAGWRGLAAGILEATVSAMDCAPTELLAWLGPGIGSESFEVGQDVRDVFLLANPGNANAFKPVGDRWLADLYLLAKQVLERIGVEQVFNGAYCTYLDQGRFFSYRRDGETGRMLTAIWSTD